MSEQLLQKICSYTDESGQDTRGKFFVVSTAIIPSNLVDSTKEQLIDIEKQSGKVKKWHGSGNQKREAYINLLVEKKMLKNITIYFSRYTNKSDYSTLIGAHIAKAIITCTKDSNYKATVFIDKMDKQTLEKIKKDIKTYKIRYKKIRGLPEEADPLIRLADAMCGLLRDLEKKNIPASYKKVFKRLIEL